MIQGKGITSYDVRIEGGSGVRVTQITDAENPDFIFVDVRISSLAKPGVYTLVFKEENGSKTFRYPYIIRERDKARFGAQ